MDSNTVLRKSDFSMHPAARIGHVSLNVPDLDSSLDFYKSILGFKTVGKISDNKALLSVEGNPSHLVELHAVKNRGEPGTLERRAGLYHFAILLPERRHLADMLQHLRGKRDQVHLDGLADHLVSEAIYIRDPDLNGIEIYRDRPSAEWVWNGSQVKMATLKLDTENLQKQSTSRGWKAMPAKTIIGHIHLHVSNLAKALRFYSKVLGLNFTAVYPGAYFFAAGRYHHHVATNTWLGTEILPAAPDKVGLNHFAIELPNGDELERTLRNILQSDVGEKTRSAYIQDSDGIRICLYSK
jgi:catechol 2,3-dioxygenase